jgi:outer membrane protein assembly factor BamB
MKAAAIQLVRLSLLLACCSPRAFAADWPMLGRTSSRNAVSPEKDPPLFWQWATRDANGQLLQPTKNIKWTAQLGSFTVGDPVVSDGLIWVGTNNHGLDPNDKSDAAVLLCIRASDGKRLYAYRSPRLQGQLTHDFPHTSLACSPLIEGDRLWFTTNRCETVCLDIAPLLHGGGEPRVIWKVDMLRDLNVRPFITGMGFVHQSSVASYRDWIYVITGNGADIARKSVPHPEAPSLACLEKNTGKLVWEDHSPGANILEAQWSSPLAAEIDGQGQIITPQGDGWLRSFDPATGKLLWEFDMNFKESLWKYQRSTRLSLLAAPVLFENRIYLGSGTDPDIGEHGGRLCCIDPTRRGDISSELAQDATGKPLPRRRVQAIDKANGEQAVANPNSGLIWEFTKVGNTFEDVLHDMTTQVAVADGLVIAADEVGLVHCFDAKTGRRHWYFDMLTSCHASPLIVGDSVYVANLDGEVLIFGLSADPKRALRNDGKQQVPLARITNGDCIGPIYASPIFSNGVLYLAGTQKLVAVSAATDPADKPRDSELSVAGAAGRGYWPQYRGPRRDNISTETDLLKQWPAEGPPLVWRVDGLGDGVPCPVVGYRLVYVVGRNANAELLLALNEEDGSLVWARATGPVIPDNPLMRWINHRTPVVEKERVYVVHPSGELTCFSTREGRELWRINYAADLGGKPAPWGFGDTPLVDDERLICAPGGPGTALVALDKRTGELLWKRALPGDSRAGYSETIVATFGGVKQYIRQFDAATAGFAAADGQLLWSRGTRSGGRPARFTPVPAGETLIIPDGPGLSQFSIARVGETWKVEEVREFRGGLDYFSDNTLSHGDTLLTFRGGIIPAIFRLSDGAPLWSGQRMTQGKIATSFADERVYVRFSDGTVQLLEIEKEGVGVRGTFMLPDHKQAIGATLPVVAGGRLYLRDDDHLFCYDVAAGAVDRPRAAPRTTVLSLPENLGAGVRERVGTGRAPDAIFVPTPHDVAARMLTLAGVKKTDVVCDLGSGDGRIVIAAAKSYGCRATGYEINPELVKESREAAASDTKIAELVRIEHQDLFTADLSGADVVTVYLPPRLLERLLPQLAKLKPGARIVSHFFEIPGVKPDKSESFESTDDSDRHTLHLWTAPLKASEEKK